MRITSSMLLLVFCVTNVNSQGTESIQTTGESKKHTFSINPGIHYNSLFRNKTSYPNSMSIIDPGLLGDRDSVRHISKWAPNLAVNYSLYFNKSFFGTLGFQYLDKKDNFQCWGDSVSISPLRPAIVTQNNSYHGFSIPLRIGVSLDRFFLSAGINLLLFEIHNSKYLLANNDTRSDTEFNISKLDVSQRLIPALHLDVELYEGNVYKLGLFAEAQMRDVDYYDLLFGIRLGFNN